MSKELATRLDPRAIEPARYQVWQDGGYFHVPASAVLEDGREPYVIVIPPPNVTAALHMGHGLNNTVQTYSFDGDECRVGRPFGCRALITLVLQLRT